MNNLVRYNFPKKVWVKWCKLTDEWWGLSSMSPYLSSNSSVLEVQLYMGFYLYTVAMLPILSYYDSEFYSTIILQGLFIYSCKHLGSWIHLYVNKFL